MFLKTKHLEFDCISSVCKHIQKPGIIKVCYAAPWWAVKVLHVGSECFIADSFGQIKNQMSDTSYKFLCVKKALVQLCLQYHYNAGDDGEKLSHICLQSLRPTAAFKFGLLLQVPFIIDDVKFDAPLEFNLCDQCWVTNLHNAHCVIIISLEKL